MHDYGGHMMVKSILLALTIVVALVLQAQPSAGQTAGGQLGTVSGADVSVPLGWNFLHPLFCYNPALGANNLIVLTDLGGIFLIIFDRLTQDMVVAACQTGNLVAVFNDSPSTFNQLITYPHK
jgi:hypothetical protein